MKRLLLAVAAGVVSIALIALLVAAFGKSPSTFLVTLIRGSVGSTHALAETLVKSIPLLLTALSVLVAFRAGVWNIGAEGQFIVGGICAYVAASFVTVPWLSWVAALVAAAIGGAAWSAVAAWLKLARNTPEVLSTILLNFVAIYLLGWCVNGPLQERGGQYPQSDAIPDAAFLPAVGSSRLHAGMFIALAAAIAIYWLLDFTREGLRLRASGFNPAAARFAGIPVRAQIARAMAISGALAGLGGGAELLGVTHRLFERFATGYGYSGIAVALLAQLHPLGSIASAIFFAALATGAGELQRSGDISSYVAVLMQGVVILILLLFASPWLATFVKRKREAGR